MRPEWLKCETCLWWDFLNGANFCHHSSRADVNHSEEDSFYCEHWTCANCWKGWNTITDTKINLSADPNDAIWITRPGDYTDHSKCQPVKFGGKDER